MTNCPICWVRRRISDRRMRVVTELRLSDGSTKRVDVSIKEHRERRAPWPKDARLVFTTCVAGRRAARSVTAESLREEMEGVMTPWRASRLALMAASEWRRAQDGV